MNPANPAMGMPVRPVRGFQPQGAAVNPTGSAPMVGGAPVAGGYGAPSVSVNGQTLQLGGAYTPGQGQTQVMNPGPATSPEEYAAMLELERERTKADVSAGTMAPLPTTRYTPPGSLGSDPTEAPGPQQNTQQQPTQPRYQRLPGGPMLPQ